MYTSKDRLSETIALQQRLLKQSLVEQSRCSATSTMVNKANAGQQQQQSLRNAGDTEYEWKAKRRPDGSIYITRKPMRNQIMKAREEQVILPAPVEGIKVPSGMLAWPFRHVNSYRVLG